MSIEKANGQGQQGQGVHCPMVIINLTLPHFYYIIICLSSILAPNTVLLKLVTKDIFCFNDPVPFCILLICYVYIQALVNHCPN